MAEGGDFGEERYSSNSNDSSKNQPESANNLYYSDKIVSNEAAEVDSNQESLDDQRKKREDNPFSFKKFLKSGGARPKSGESIYNSSNSRSGALATLDLANDLPDFVQTPTENVRIVPEVSLHAHSEERRRPRKPPSDIFFPDLTIKNDNSVHNNTELNIISPSYSNLGNGLSPPPSCSSLNNLPGSYVRNNETVPDPSHDEQFSERYTSINNSQPQTAHMIGCLPDFLSDSALNLTDNRMSPVVNFSDDHRHSPHYSENDFSRIREENRQLRKQLEEARHFAEAESKRVSDIMNEMQLIRKKENEESATLENMIRKVEANLLKTQQRAEHAEAQVVKLKQENKNLKAQMQSILLEGGANYNGPCVTTTVREKTKYASEQIYGAVQLAENNLKDLLKGVDTLRLVAQVLESIDKIQNTSDSQNDKNNSSND